MNSKPELAERSPSWLARVLHDASVSLAAMHKTFHMTIAEAEKFIEGWQGCDDPACAHNQPLLRNENGQ